ncbi:MAG: hypothetical protein KDC61_01690 [Saprospiraceae bacterium]|nr:hypothetical protein [Saprospiraceae bacterium]MCB0542696.1 hypothetical protein [Saprospiraceae bacterium]MCB0573260.1 hypothetical protein [Saprospiraceae bacterium]MCB9306093.1 hypothetical protein [Lewinellaceae bacterium]MCB9356215.1 hypothetical protein [Lewinellaceae bacterium]
MNKLFTPRQTAILAALLIVLITAVIPNTFKSLFSAESGHLKILPGIGPLLALGLLLRWRRVRQIAYLAFAIAFFITLIIGIMTPEYRPGFLLMSGLIAILLAVLGSQPMKAYLQPVGHS